MEPTSNRALQPFTSLPLTPALVMLLLFPQSRCAGVPWGALPPTLSVEMPTPPQWVSQRGTEPPLPLAPSGEAKSQASELRALHCTAKMQTSFNPRTAASPHYRTGGTKQRMLSTGDRSNKASPKHGPAVGATKGWRLV